MRVSNGFQILVLLAGLWSCSGSRGYVAPAPAPQRTPASTVATFDQAWDAVIDVFAQRNIPIATIDRSSGLIAATSHGLASTDAIAWADCGIWKELWTGSVPIIANRAEFNVLVRRQTGGASVRVTARWVAEAPNPAGATVTCQSRNVWEPGLEASIKSVAEKPR